MVNTTILVTLHFSLNTTDMLCADVLVWELLILNAPIDAPSRVVLLFYKAPVNES